MSREKNHRSPDSHCLESLGDLLSSESKQKDCAFAGRREVWGGNETGKEGKIAVGMYYINEK